MALVPGVLDMTGPTLATAPVYINAERNRSVADYLAAVQQQAAEIEPFEHAGLKNNYHPDAARRNTLTKTISM
jgi:hypothetical protein